MYNYKIHEALDSSDLSKLAADTVAAHINIFLAEKERVQVSLSGGSTPSKAYLLLSNMHLPWDRVDVFLGDERWVSPDHPQSNQNMLSATLLSSSPGNQAKLHPMPIENSESPEECANSFSKLMKKVCANNNGFPLFDLILLGLGDDGHTASLFPYSKSLKVLNRSTTVSLGNDLQRISVTAPVLCSARKVIFLVSGKTKQVALKRLLDSSESTDRTPARLVESDSEIIILADKDAMSLL